MFCFGLAALAAPRLIRRFSMGPLLGLTMAAVICGCALRLAPSLFTLFAGTAVLGIGIAVGNVLLPGLIKRDFPVQRVLMTALYSVALSGGAAIAAGLTVPLEHATGIGWRVAITVWGVFAVLALILWIPARARRASTGGGHDPGAGSRPLARPAGLVRERLHGYAVVRLLRDCSAGCRRSCGVMACRPRTQAGCSPMRACSG